jgi:hypothetical protein
VCCFNVLSCFYLSLFDVSGMCIYFNSVYYICLIVLVGSVVLFYGFYYFCAGTNYTLAPDYGRASLAAVWAVDAFVFASRAFAIWTYLARISSSFSIN